MVNVTTAFFLTLNYASGLPPTNATATPAMRGIVYDAIVARGARVLYSLDGLPESPIAGVAFVGVDGTGARTLSAKCDYVANSTCSGVAPACPPCFR